MGPRRFGRGDIFLHPQLRVRAASMGPRPFGRGDLNSPANQQQRYRLQWGRGLSAAETSARRDGRATRKCFNGAAAFRPRRLGRRTQSPTRNPGFNGAAAFRPRRRTNKRSVRAAETLQWGRGLSAAETNRPCSPSRVVVLQWGRGLSAAETPSTKRPCARRGSFNGAAAFRPRRRLARPCPACAQELQWGRGLSAAETFPWRAALSRTSRFNGAAAFRPRRRGG